MTHNLNNIIGNRDFFVVKFKSLKVIHLKLNISDFNGTVRQYLCATDSYEPQITIQESNCILKIISENIFFIEIVPTI